MLVHENEQVLNENKESSTAPEVAMKTLPSSLNYTLLVSNSTYPIIINSELNSNDLDRLVNVVQKPRKAIGYTIDDIKGISPSICTRRINLEPNITPFVEGQRRLNPNMKEVVKKEVLKLLNVESIYAISDRK